MPKRRRNPDGSLVTPLSERQLANLAKGRAALASKVSETKESAPADEGETGERGGRKVETVRLGAKARRGETKARASKKTRSASKTQTRTRSKASDTDAKESTGGLVDRAIEWFGRGE